MNAEIIVIIKCIEVLDVSVEGQLVDGLLDILNTILDPAMDGPPRGVVGCEVVIGGHHLHHIFRLLHGSKIISDNITHTWNSISITNYYPNHGKVAVHLIRWHHGRQVTLLLDEHTCKEIMLLQFNKTFQDIKARA